MGLAITDTTGAPLNNVALEIDADAESVVVVGLVPCIDGMFLTVANTPQAAVLARRAETADPFVDIDAAPIDLTPYDGQTIPFEFKIAAGSVAGNLTVALPVRVTFSP